MGSTRLPGKVLKPVGERTVLGHILYRLKLLQHDVIIIVATSDLDRDDVIEEFCKNNNTLCFRSSETNVLYRYYECAKLYNLKHIVRLTGDNPFTDIEELDRLIDFHFEMHTDFCHSLYALPVGSGAEIFTFDALETAVREATDSHHFEHVDEYLLEHPERFKTSILEVPGTKFYPDIRLTIDNEKDYQVACSIMEKTRQADLAGIEEAISFCMLSV